MNERYKGNRTAEEDGLIVWGVDPAMLGAWPEYADREFRDPAVPPELIKRHEEEENPDGEMLDWLIGEYLANQDDRILVGLSRMGKSFSAIEGIFAACGISMPEEKARRRMARCVRVLSAAYKLELAHNAAGEIDLSPLTETERTIWALYRVGTRIAEIGETLGVGKLFALESTKKTILRIGSLGLWDYVDAVEDLRHARALGGHGKISRNLPGGHNDDQNEPEAPSDCGDAAASA